MSYKAEYVSWLSHFAAANISVSFWRYKSNSVFLGIVLLPISLQFNMPLGSPVKWLKLHICMCMHLHINSIIIYTAPLQHPEKCTKCFP